MTEVPFWQQKTLEELSPSEWESLCDGCGRCCLNKLEDWDTGEISWTNVACRLLDSKSCRCKNYTHRQKEVADCISLTPDDVRQIGWLPPTCGYRLVAEGQDLYWWHPLISGDPETVHEAGISVRNKTVDENDVAVEDYEDYLVDWPEHVPKASLIKR